MSDRPREDEGRYHVLAAGPVEMWIVEAPDRLPAILHVGRPLRHAPPVEAVRGASQGTRLDEDPLSLLPDPARGWTGPPGWNGTDPLRPWQHGGTRAGAGCIAVDFQHPGGRALSLAIRVVSDGLFALDALVRAADGQYRDTVSYTLPLPASAAEGLAFSGRWAGELAPERGPLAGGRHRLSRAGSRSAHDAFPAFLAGEDGFAEDRGELLALHLGWFGNYDLAVIRARSGRFLVQVTVAPAEMAATADGGRRLPTLYLGWSDGGLNGIRRCFQDGARRVREVAGSAAPGKVQLNTWEGVYFGHDLARLKAMASAAAALGVERFVLDDGWFGRRLDDTRGLGDWVPRADVYPGGLGELMDHVLGEGLEFGLWVEPEMVSADSALYEAHSEWILGPPDQPLGRHQYSLNLCEPSCFEHLERVLAALVADRRISSLKWDMNRDVPQAAGQPLVPAALALISAVKAARGDLQIEACASGGARSDWSALGWCNRVWLSDAHDPDIRLPMMAAYGLFAPAEVMGAHIGPQTSHQTGRRWSLHARASVAVLGSMGLELDPLSLDDEARATVADYVALHKRHRSWMSRGHLLVLPHPDPGLTAVGVFGPARDRALICLLQRVPRSSEVPAPLAVRHLDGTLVVRVPVLDPAVPRTARRQPGWVSAEPLEVTSAFLAGHGLPLPVIPPMRAVLVEVLPRA